MERMVRKEQSIIQKSTRKITTAKVVELVSQKLPHLPSKDVECGISQIINYMTKALISGRHIEIRNFGSFLLRYHSSRNARNPRTGETFTAAPKYIARFKPGKNLRAGLKYNYSLPNLTKNNEQE